MPATSNPEALGNVCEAALLSPKRMNLSVCVSCWSWADDHLARALALDEANEQQEDDAYAAQDDQHADGEYQGEYQGDYNGEQGEYDDDDDDGNYDDDHYMRYGAQGRTHDEFG